MAIIIILIGVSIGLRRQYLVHAWPFLPTMTATSTSMQTRTSSPTNTRTASPQPTETDTPRPTEKFTQTQIPSPTITLTPSPFPSATVPPPTATPTASKTLRPTRTPSPTLTSIPSSVILYSEDFEDGEAQWWTDSVGTQSVEEEDNNFYYQITGPENYPQSWLDSDYIDMSDWTDYAFEVRVRFVSGTLFMCARAEGGSAFYTFYVGSNDDYVALSEYDRNQNVEWGGYDISESYTILHNRWYTFRFELDGDKLSLYIDDKLASTSKANQPLVRESGGIGFYMGGGDEIHFDDIRVWRLP